MSSSSSTSHGSGEEEEINSGDLTALQKHVVFFDRNKDGIIYPWETFRGFRAIGCGVALSTVSAVVINGFLGPKTRTGKIPSPLLPIYVKNIHKGKHGSDSGVYDSEGRFVPEKFEEIFKKHAHTNPNALTSKELKEMLKANRVPKDYKGWVASWTEWKILFALCKDKDGLLHKDTMRAVYDGSLFLQMEQARESSQKKAKKA
ncbi:putative peroxygenase 4 [Cocos nucifera]|nr:putative peroxygenase 4 [Cocos nucifera]